MCEMFGQSFNKPIRPGKEMSAFLERGIYNPDGTGIAYALPDQSMIVMKQPVMALKSPMIEKVLKSPDTVSDLFMLHVRLKSYPLKVSYNNTHPFKDTLDGVDYVFAHNGSLKGRSRNFNLGSYVPKGLTDSEFCFCFILSEISKNVKTWNSNSFDWLHARLSDINGIGTFNIMMSNSEYLFCYSDISNHNEGLGYVWHQPNTVISEQTAEELPEGYTISTRSLSQEPFTQFSPGELKVYKQGEEVYSSKERRENEGIYFK